MPGYQMQSEILKKITAAEKEAAELKSAALAQARQLKAEAEAEGKRLCEEAASVSARGRERMIASAASKADAITRDMRAQASDDIALLSEKAGKRTAEAAEYIAREIMSRCR